VIRQTVVALPRLAAYALLAVGAATQNATADELAAGRAAFAREYAAINAGGPSSPASDSVELRAYPLYPYLQRARTARALEHAAATLGPADEAAREFLAAHHGEPVATLLRRTWLRSLAARGLWTPFAEHYQRGIGDTRLHCQWLSARIALHADDTVRAAVIDQWLDAAERLPPECEPPFAWLRAENALSADLIERRVRAVLENGHTAFARTLAQRLPAVRAAPLLHAAELLEQPEQGIDALLAGADARPGDDEALLAAWRKLARARPSAALERYDGLRQRLERDGKSASPHALALALGLAWDRRATEALALFGAVNGGEFDDSARAWQARAALWAGDWAQTERAIEAMSIEQQNEPRWRYWRARGAAARGDDSLAATLYTALQPTDNFYAASAAARLGRKVEPHPAPLAADETALRALASDPSLLRARELLAVDLRVAAVSEWLHALGQLDAGQRSQAVHLAARWQWHDIAVATATRQSVFFDYALLYPRPYDLEVDAAAALTRLDAPLLYAIIRQESLFRADAVSAAGAVGLAQLRPSTARIAARGWQRPAPSAADLLDPATNIALGAAHFADLLEELGQHPAVALAGYNAGPRAAERWLPSEPLDADIWIENIPFNETRDYVQRVLWHRVVFAWLESKAGQDFGRWLAPIAPPPADANDATTAAG